MSKFILLGLFFIFMVAVGIYSRKKVSNSNDFLLGGRKVGPWFSAFSYGTTYFSAVIFIGYAGRIGWNFGISATWIGIGNAVIGSLLAWLIMAKRTRQMTQEMNASTMPEFFEKRYDSKPMKIITGAIIFIFLVPYTASVYQGLGYLFEQAFKVSYVYCMLAMAVLTGIYLMLGGYIATALNNFIQGIIMLAGVIAMLYYIISNPAVGGLGEGISRLASINPDLTSPVGPSPINLLGLVTLTSLGSWGLPQMVHKFYAIKDESAIKKGTIISTLFCLIIAGGAYFVGGFGRLFFQYNNTAVPGNSDMIMPMVLEWALPDALFGLIIVLVLSASMSTLSSLVLVSSSSVTIDLLKSTVYQNMSKKTEMLLLRIFCVIFVIFSFIVAITPNAILTLMSFSWGTISGAFIGPFLYGLYWKGTTKAGAWAGIISGLICSLGGALLYGMNAGLAPNIGAVAMIVSLITVPIVSAVTSKSTEVITSKTTAPVTETVRIE
ncbi:MAG TPA: sodium/solute symporter [Clostridiaceae bacterium]|nr:sodium/solute symporter [Clostridiaceae bacterium]